MAVTSIKTTPGWSDNAVQAAYSTLFGWQLSHGVVWVPQVDFEPKQVPHSGDSVTVQLNQFYTDADVTAAKTPLDEETDVTPTKLPVTKTVTFTPQERGFTNQRTLKLANRGLTPVDPVIARAVADHSARLHDQLVQDAARQASEVLYGGTATSTVTVTGAMTAKAAMIRKAVTTLRGKAAGYRSGQFFLGIVHPNVIHDLREESGTGSWRVPNEYGASQSQIWNGEFGEFEGVRFVSDAHLLRATDNDGATGTVVYRGFIMGREALGKCVIESPSIKLGPATDSLGRFRTIGWYSDLDYKIYRDEAIVALQTASSLG